MKYKERPHPLSTRFNATSFSWKEDPSFANDVGSFIRGFRGRARARLLIRRYHEKESLSDKRSVFSLDSAESHSRYNNGTRDLSEKQIDSL